MRAVSVAPIENQADKLNNQTLAITAIPEAEMTHTRYH